MKVYVVTSGDYSSYRIEKVFFNKEKARFYQMINCPSDGYVEEYEISDDVVNDNQRNRPVKVEYNIRSNLIMKLGVCKEEQDTNQIKFKNYEPYYIFTLKLGTGRLFSNVMRFGRGSKMLQKIAQDRLAKHMYERETSKEELIKRAEQMFYDKYGSYPYTHIASTSIPDTHEVHVNPVAEAVNKKLHDIIASGGELPCSIDDLYKQTADELGIKTVKIVQNIKVGGKADDSESDS